MKATDARPTGEMCPSAETLTAFLAATRSLPPELTADGQACMSADEQHIVNTHVAACDLCIEELRTAQRRLQMAADIPVAVPAAIASRAAAPAPQTAPALAGIGAWAAGWRQRISAAVRLPVLVPAFAAIALLIVIAPWPQTSTTGSGELSRSVEQRQPARVTAETAAVRGERNTAAAAIATLPRGTSVVLLREDNGWFRVALADGTEGWIERTAFE